MEAVRTKTTVLFSGTGSVVLLCRHPCSQLSRWIPFWNGDIEQVFTVVLEVRFLKVTQVFLEQQRVIT